MKPSDRIVAYVPGRICAKWAGPLADMARVVYGGSLPDDLATMLDELDQAGAAYSAVIALAGSGRGSAERSDNGGLPHVPVIVDPMSASAAAAHLGISDSRVRLLCRRGRLRACRPDGARAWQIDPASVDAYQQQKEAT